VLRIVAGVLMSIAAMFSYPLVFMRWPITRDVPWANLLLFGLAGVLVVTGLRVAWQPGRWRIVRILLGTVGAGLSAFIAASFIYSVFVTARQLPPSTGAPQVGQRAPEFTLADIHNTPVALSALLSEPISSRPPRGVLLIFYRGYW
jgi:hypothetical protein